jgi:hypothetical protein
MITRHKIIKSNESEIEYRGNVRLNSIFV